MTDENGKSKAKKAAEEAAAQVEEAVKGPLDEFVERERAALREAGKAVEALLPEKFWTHSRKAAEEFTAGIQVLADAVITELEKVTKQVEKDDDEKPSTTGPAKVKVQVE